MSLQITPKMSYRQAAQVAMLAFAIGSDLPTGILSTAETAACAALGLFCVHAVSRINEERLIARHSRLYKVAPALTNVSTIQEQTLEREIEKIKTLKSYKWYMKLHKIEAEGELRHWKQEISGGICYGEAAALLDVNLDDNEIFSLKNSLARASPEEAITKQIAQHLWPMVEIKKDGIERTWERKRSKFAKTQMEKFPGSLWAQHLMASAFDPIPNDERAFKLEKYDAEAMRLKALIPVDHLSIELVEDRANRFHADAPVTSWQRHLESATQASSVEDGCIRGCIHLPKHVMAFQYGPEEYFIYDPFSQDGGLFQYPDKKCFFEGARLLVECFMRKRPDKSREPLVSFQIYQNIMI